MMRLRKLLVVTACAAVLLLSCQTTKVQPATAATDSVIADAGMQVGLVFDRAGRGDRSYCDLAYQGLTQIAKVYNGRIEGGDPGTTDFGRELKIICLQPNEDGRDGEVKVRALAQAGCQLIYCIRSEFTDAVRKISRDFPRSHFMLVDGLIPALTARSNVTCLLFRQDEGAFLVGAIAAIKAEGRPIGFLGGADIPTVHAIENAFIGGAIYADRRYWDTSHVLKAHVGTTASGFNDPGSAYREAKALYARGATIVFHYAGHSGDGLFQAAAEANRKAIGSRADEGLRYGESAYPRIRRIGEAILTSSVNRIDSAVFLSGRDFLENKGLAAGGYRWFGLLESGVEFAMNEYNKAQLDGFFATILHIRSDVVNRYVTVPNEGTAMDIWASRLK